MSRLPRTRRVGALLAAAILLQGPAHQAARQVAAYRRPAAFLGVRNVFGDERFQSLFNSARRRASNALPCPLAGGQAAVSEILNNE